MFAQSFQPADDLLAVVQSLADRIRAVDWRRRSAAGLDAVLLAVAVIHVLSIRLAPHVLGAVARFAQWLACAAAQAEGAATVLALQAETPAPVAAAPRSAATLTVLELRELARARGIRTVAGGRRVGSANRAALLAALA